MTTIHDEQCEAERVPGDRRTAGCECQSRHAQLLGIATLRPGKYEVAVGNAKVGTVWGDYAIGFRAVALDGRVVGMGYPTPDAAAEALATHVAFWAVVDAEIAAWVAQVQRRERMAS